MRLPITSLVVLIVCLCGASASAQFRKAPTKASTNLRVKSKTAIQKAETELTEIVKVEPNAADQIIPVECHSPHYTVGGTFIQLDFGTTATRGIDGDDQ